MPEIFLVSALKVACFGKPLSFSKPGQFVTLEIISTHGINAGVKVKATYAKHLIYSRYLRNSNYQHYYR